MKITNDSEKGLSYFPTALSLMDLHKYGYHHAACAD